MNIPPIQFSKWHKWSERASIPNAQEPGVYVLAKFDEVPAGDVDPMDARIIYFGETCNNTLKGRWNQFNNSAFKEKPGHSGGWTYAEVYKDKGDNLYVAACSFDAVSETLRPLLIRFVERKLIWDYARKFGVPPKINRK